MPVTTSYPGVYIEEIPSGVRTITGVATSTAAFIGRAEKGPVNEATEINSFGDYSRIFGGFQMYTSMAFAVRDFFLNGGSKAVIVRLFKTGGVAQIKSRVTTVIGGTTVVLEAASPGLWGQGLRASFDFNVSSLSAAAMGVAASDLFNLTIKLQDRITGAVLATETFRNLTLINSSRRVDKILAEESNLATWLNAAPSVVLPQVTTPAGFTAALPVNDDVTNTTATVSSMVGDDGAFLTYSAKGAGAASDNGDFSPSNGETVKIGLYALEQVDLFNVLVTPPFTQPSDDVVSGDVGTSAAVRVAFLAEAAAYCEKRRAMLLVDPPPSWNSKTTAKANLSTDIGLTSKNAALYFPRLLQVNSLRSDRLEEFVSAGAIAGVWARTDTSRGVWKAPAGLDATLVGAPDLEVALTDAENGELNPLGINCLRVMPAAGRIVWGARTLQGDDRLASEWKYVPVRRTALYIEESLFRGTQWVVFEPNDEPLWAQIRLNVGSFMQGLFRQGAFQGQTPKDAYFVKCDKETTTQDDINKGIVNIVVGFAPLKPAEFVIIKLQQMAGQIAV
jgi:phage tail sheath protein FI